MADDQAPPPSTPSEPTPVETAQMPAHEPLSAPIAASSETAPIPTLEAVASVPSEPAEPVSEAADVATESQTEAPEPEPKATVPSSRAASAASAVGTNTASKAERNRELLQKANVKRRDNKQKNLDKIIAELEKRGKITNDEVEKLLRCSDATASRYLLELVKQGKIKKVGATGSGVHYVKA